MKTNAQIGMFITVIGISFTAVVMAFVCRQQAREGRALLAQNHQATIKIMSRDLDDLRQQLKGLYGPRSAAQFKTLTFQKNQSGHVGVRGVRPAQSWIPIENSNQSAFRGSLPQKQRVYAEVFEGARLLDHTNAVRPKTAAATLTSPIPGSNLTLRSHLGPGDSGFSFPLLLTLGAIFWLYAGSAVSLLLEDDEMVMVPRPRPGLAPFRPIARPELDQEVHRFLPRPVKNRLPEYAELERSAQEIVIPHPPTPPQQPRPEPRVNFDPSNVVRRPPPEPVAVRDAVLTLNPSVQSYDFVSNGNNEPDQIVLPPEDSAEDALKVLLNRLSDRLQEKSPEVSRAMRQAQTARPPRDWRSPGSFRGSLDFEI